MILRRFGGKGAVLLLLQAALHSLSQSQQLALIPTPLYGTGVGEKHPRVVVLPPPYLGQAATYRDRRKGVQILLSRTQAGPDRTGKQEQEQTSRNQLQTL